MKSRLCYLAIFLTLGLAVSGCSSEDAVAPEANLSVSFRIDNSSANTFNTKGAGTAGEVADSVIVTRVRVLVERMILHPEGSKDSADDRSVKAGPFLLLADSTGTRVSASARLTPGLYSKLKYEIHRFSSSEIASYKNDPQFADFVSDGRYSVIIDGHVVANGTRRSFQYRSDVTSNVEVSLGSFSVPESGNVTASIVFSTAKAFVDNTRYLDPSDSKNESIIDNNLKSAFRLNP